MVIVFAGKYRTAAVTDEGDVYMWEGLSKQHPHRKKAAKDALLPPRPDKATSRKLSLSNIVTPERCPTLLSPTIKCCMSQMQQALLSAHLIDILMVFISESTIRKT